MIARFLSRATESPASRSAWWCMRKMFNFIRKLIKSFWYDEKWISFFLWKKYFFSKLWRRFGCGTENLDDLICRDFRITAISGFLTLGLSACIFHPTGSYCTYGIIRIRHDAKFKYRGSQIGSEFLKYQGIL